MTTEALWQVTVETIPESEEAVAALMERLFGTPASSFTNEEGRCWVTVFLKQDASSRTAKRTALEAGLRYISDCGLDLGPGTIRVAKVPREDWSESWKKYFKTIQISSRLLVRPTWSKQKPLPGQALVVLDPGLSFGTGQHPTTLYCLEQLVACRNRTLPQSMLDAGTGSGILAIAAAKLGYAPVTAFDNDPQAVRIAGDNARKNRVQEKIRLTRKDLAKLPAETSQPYDLICANLIDDLLIQESRRLLNRLKPHGRLVVAGILSRHFPAVQKHFEKKGLTLTDSRTEGEWQSATFTWRAVHSDT